MAESQSAVQTSPSAGAESLFQTSSHPRLTFGTLLLFLLSMVFVLGGFYLMGAAFGGSEADHWLFAGGLAADAFGFWMAFGLIPNRGQR